MVWPLPEGGGSGGGVGDDAGGGTDPSPKIGCTPKVDILILHHDKKRV